VSAFSPIADDASRIIERRFEAVAHEVTIEPPIDTSDEAAASDVSDSFTDKPRSVHRSGTRFVGRFSWTRSVADRSRYLQTNHKLRVIFVNKGFYS